MSILLKHIYSFAEKPRKNKYIMTVCCLFSKWPEATALPGNIAIKLLNFCCTVLPDTDEENLLTRSLIISIIDIYMYLNEIVFLRLMMNCAY